MIEFIQTFGGSSSTNNTQRTVGVSSKISKLKEKNDVKVCLRCNVPKNLSEFYFRKDGYYFSYCYECERKRNSERLDYRLNWAKNHKDSVNDSRKKYFDKVGKEKISIWRDNYFKKNPWIKSYRSSKSRCSYKGSPYFKRKISFSMTIEDFKELWFRDKAWLLERPSIDRKDPKQGYIKSNCRFIELKENISRKRGVAVL